MLFYVTMYDVRSHKLFNLNRVDGKKNKRLKQNLLLCM